MLLFLVRILIENQQVFEILEGPLFMSFCYFGQGHAKLKSNFRVNINKPTQKEIEMESEEVMKTHEKLLSHSFIEIPKEEMK